MEEKNGGELLSESTLNNEQLDKATEETIQRIQGGAEGTTTYGEVINKAFADIDAAADSNKKSLQELAEEYKQLSEVISTVLKAIANEIVSTQVNLPQSDLDLSQISLPQPQSGSGSSQKTDYENFIESEDYVKLFSQLDSLLPVTMVKLRNKLESEWKKLDLTPKEIEELNKKFDEATKTIREKNPFTVLADAIKGFKDKERSVKLKDIVKETGVAFKATKASLDGVVNAMPDTIPSQKINKELVGDISNMVGSAGDIMGGIMSMNWSQVIQGSIKLLSSTMKVLNSGDRRADKEIAEHAKEIKNLEDAYGNLEKAMDRALGSGKYSASKSAIENLQKQQKSIEKQIELEESKKKSDDKKVKEYENAMESVKNKQIELINKLRSDIMGIDAKSAAQQLGDAFIEAFGKGENAVEAFGKKVDDIVANIIKRMLIQKLLEEPVGKILDRYSQKWYDDQGNFSGFDAVMKDADQMGKELKEIGPNFTEAMEKLPDDIKKYFVGPEDSGSGGLTGAIKGASEETMNMAAGQLNAMRINQVDANEIMRHQLMHLSRISQNTSYNKYLKSIDERIERMEYKDSLRSQGLS